MSRLVVQHPSLAIEAVAAFTAELGRAPSRLERACASWDDVIVEAARLDAMAERWQVDAEIVPMHARLGDYRLIAFDMDSTMITIECVDEIADFAGRKAEVAAITEAAMRGDIADYDESLRRRVALLAGLPESILARVYEERLRLSPGVERLLQAVRAAGLRVLLVSGGFTYFTERLAARLGIDFTRANTLGIAARRLTGTVDGDIVNAELKKRTLEETCARIGCSPAQAIVVGDGANDLKMMSIAGMSVAYRAKPVVHTETTHAINHCGLDAILNFFEPQPPAARQPRAA